MALAEGWEPAFARTLFNGAGNGCFPNQSFESREIPILWTGFMVSFLWDREEKENGQKLIPWRSHRGPFSNGNWGCLWNKLAWETISSKHKSFSKCVQIFWSLQISEISNIRFSPDIGFSGKSLKVPLPPSSGLEAPHLCCILITGLPCCFGMVLSIRLWVIDDHGYCLVILAPAGPRMVLFSKRLLYQWIKEWVLSLPSWAWYCVGGDTWNPSK